MPAKCFSWQKWNPYKYRAHLTVATILPEPVDVEPELLSPVEKSG